MVWCQISTLNIAHCLLTTVCMQLPWMTGWQWKMLNPFTTLTISLLSTSCFFPNVLQLILLGIIRYFCVLKLVLRYLPVDYSRLLQVSNWKYMFSLKWNQKNMEKCPLCVNGAVQYSEKCTRENDRLHTIWCVCVYRPSFLRSNKSEHVFCLINRINVIESSPLWNRYPV